MTGGGSGYPCHEPPFLLETRLKGLSPGQRALRRVNSLPDLGQTILDGGQWAGFSLFTCCAGRATRSPSAGGAAWPPETSSISEPSRASASLDHLTPQRPQSGVRPGLRIPEDRDFLHLLVGNNHGVNGASCLPETGWGQGTVGRSSLRSGGCRLASPQRLSTKLLLPHHPPRPSEQHLWVSVLAEPRPKPAQGWGRG